MSDERNVSSYRSHAFTKASIDYRCRAFQGDQAGLKAAYRFFDNEQISEEALLAPHSMATFERMRQHPMILAPQDTTFYDLSHHPNTTEVGFTTQQQTPWFACAFHDGFLCRKVFLLAFFNNKFGFGTKKMQASPKKEKTLPVEQRGKLQMAACLSKLSMSSPSP